MKKFVVLFAMMAMASPVFAGTIVGSKHDLSTGGFNTPATGTDQVCVFCHTPHAANITVANAPLWNRSLVTTDVTQFYNSATLDDASNAYRTQAVDDAINRSDVKLCLSCHDGVAVQKALRNPPNGDTMVYTVLSVGTEANIGTDLRDDHPIGMVYATVQGNDATGFELETDVIADGLTFYDGGRMWCSTCHDVHDPDLGTPFLATTNAASALCTTCHIK